MEIKHFDAQKSPKLIYTIVSVIVLPLLPVLQVLQLLQVFQNSIGGEYGSGRTGRHQPLATPSDT